MGETISQEGIASKVQIFQELAEGPLGKVKVLRTKQPPYQFLMQFKKSYMDSRERLKKEEGIFKRLKSIEHPNLSRIWECQIRQEEQLCIKHQTLYIYASYYNFTLHQAVQIKKRTGYNFSEEDLLYLGSSLINTALQLSRYGIVKGNYKLQELFLSPEGYLKLYLLDLDSQNRHSCYYTVLTEPQRLKQFLLAPQQLQSLKKLELQAKFNQFKAELFAIGLVLVELITLDNSCFFYSLETMQIKINKLFFVIDSYSHSYSIPFLNLLKQFLEPDPQKRMNLEMANECLTQLMKNKKKTHCIRLEGDMNPQKLHIGNKKSPGLTHFSKLTPKPISLQSSTSNSKPFISTRPSIKRITHE